MPPTPTEIHLAELAERTFLKLWSYPSPYWKKGNEFADLLVVFGNDILVFSDKASTYQSNDSTIAWRRWYQRTVTESVKQLKGAVRQLMSQNSKIYLDARASLAFPFALPPVEDRRLHLIGVVHPDHQPGQTPPGFQAITFDSTVQGDESPFRVGAVHLGDRLVHLFEGRALELLLAELDTVADLVSYLRHRDQVIASRSCLSFDEPDLLALSLETRGACGWPLVELPVLKEDGRTAIPSGAWEAYTTDTMAERRREDNRTSYTIDRLIEHFHAEYVSDRYLQDTPPTYASHEHALRQLASETRFGRRLIASALDEILVEPDQTTFWTAAVESPNRPGTLYVWLTYPPLRDDLALEEAERSIMNHLVEHVFVARGDHPATLVIGIALPNPAARATSVFMAVLDGTVWDHSYQAMAENLKREKGISSTVEEIHRHHFL